MLDYLALILLCFIFFNHAWFKALLFLCAGAIIHSCVDKQDIRCLRVDLSKFPIFVCFFHFGKFMFVRVSFFFWLFF